MRLAALAVLAFGLALPTVATFAHADPPPRMAARPPLDLGAVEADRVRLSGALRPELRRRLDPAIREVVRAAGRNDKGDLTAIARQSTYRHLGNLGEGDTVAIAFIVIMEAAKSAREDLKAIMDGVKAINDAKKCTGPVRPCIEKLRLAGSLTEEQKDNLVAQLDRGLGLPQIEAMAQTSLRQAMDRSSRLETVLSAIAKKAHDTATSIISNIKG